MQTQRRRTATAEPLQARLKRADRAPKPTTRVGHGYQALHRCISMSEPTLARIPWSHYCKKVEWGLAWRGLPYRTIDIGLRGMRDWMPHLPNGTVPVLRHGETTLGESSDILRWADAQPAADDAPRMYPKGARKVASWEAWADAEIGPVARREAYRCIHGRPRQYTEKLWVHAAGFAARKQVLGVLKYYKSRRYDEHDAAFVPDAVEKIAKQLGDKPFLFGEQPTAADMATAALFAPILPIQDHPARALDEWQDVHAFVQRCKRPSTRTERRWQRPKDLQAWIAGKAWP